MATEVFSHLVQIHARERLRSIAAVPRASEHETPEDMISSGNDGIKALSALVNSIKGYAQNKDDPIVLDERGWGRPLFGTINYWGGFEDLPAILTQVGYKVIVVRLGPVSSNRERACEIWRQLSNINNGVDRGYDGPTDGPTRISINYGNGHPAARLGYLQGAWTWRSVLFGENLENWNWTWAKDRPIHFICHSQGGNSVRYLIEMLSGMHTDLFPGPDFPTESHQDWVKSVVTIGTPHKGTTVTDVVQSLLSPDFLEVLTRLVWSTSFNPPESRFYDLQLDHWGFCRQVNESLSAMLDRLVEGVRFWWDQNFHGLYDNSILGVAALDTFASTPSAHTYYFTMSFCATDQFPNSTLTGQDVNDFFALLPLNQVINPFGWFGITLPTVFRLSSRVHFLPRLQDFAVWFTDVANRHLRSMDYLSRIPRPGSQVPRPDMLPVIALPAYAMGGYQLDQQEFQALNHITSEAYQRNDGIVNTMSMSGPVNALYGVAPFPGPGE